MNIPITVTLVIIIITALISIWAFSNEKIMNDLIFYPPAITEQNQYYRFFTCGFIHADYAHLIFNMISLYFFGPFVESAFQQWFGLLGMGLFILFYLSALLVSLWPTYSANKHNRYYRSLGASGAVSAIIFAGLMLSPTSSLYLFFIPVAIPGFVFGPIYLLITYYMDKKGGGNINHSAHLWGALYGLAFIILASYLAGYPIVQNAIDDVSAYINQIGQ